MSLVYSVFRFHLELQDWFKIGLGLSEQLVIRPQSILNERSKASNAHVLRLAASAFGVSSETSALLQKTCSKTVLFTATVH